MREILVENSGCIGRIERQTARRTSYCYTAWYQFGSRSHSAAQRVNSACLRMLGSAAQPTIIILQPSTVWSRRAARHAFDLRACEIAEVADLMSDARGVSDDGMSEEG